MKAEQQRQQQTQHKDSITNEDENDETFPMKELEPDQKSNDSSSRASTPTLKIRSGGKKKERPNTEEYMGMLLWYKNNDQGGWEWLWSLWSVDSTFVNYGEAE